MNCCQCQGIEEEFNDKYVTWELSDYRKNGARKTTRMLIDALKDRGIQGLSLLDVGGGVGAIQHELLAAGVQTSMDVDASRAYLNAARSESQRRGLVDRASFQHGNFVEIAGQIPPADIVTLDRVICCYPDMEKLVTLSAAHARKLYGVVYPRDDWWVRAGLKIINFFYSLRKNRFRTFSHPAQKVEAIIKNNGFRRLLHRQTFVWQIVLYAHE
jgi:2-polyprenyl-3-methyl-5-hydroxy-6-metoxy-1,4-benzoquinol methylase